MAKNKDKKNIVLNPQGQAVTAELPNIPEAISSSQVAQDIVEGMQATLTTLGAKSEAYALPANELFIKLGDMGIGLDTVTQMYAALKQAYLTAVYVVDGAESKESLVTNVFSLLLGNAIFFRIFNDIPPHHISDVVMMVTNIMFQMEAGNDGGETTE